jgi:hypothetical protein
MLNPAPSDLFTNGWQAHNNTLTSGSSFTVNLITQNYFAKSRQLGGKELNICRTYPTSKGERRKEKGKGQNTKA